MPRIWMARTRMQSSNLEVFLHAATPRLPWRSATMQCFDGPESVWQLDREKNRDTAVEYFALADLWGHYAESSAYCLAVPVRHVGHAGENTVVTQHFVPYLSAVQLYTATRPTASLAIPRSTGSETDSWSDDSAATGGERFAGSSWDAASDDEDDSAVNGAVSSKQRGYLNFQYREWDSPYDRVPLADKVLELAQKYPCLMSLRSAELSPSSWMSVAWYPIYHIPTHGNLKGISACFLTYHSISSVFQDNIRRSGPQCDGGETTALSPFGLATYRMDGDLWRRPRSSDPRQLSELHWAASSWLKQVGAHHPDFAFFTSHHQ